MEKDGPGAKHRYSYLTSELDSAYHAAAFKCGVSDSAMRILYTICLFGDQCPLSDIVRLCGISKQTINSSLRKLEQEGMVFLQQTDGKRKTVCLTPAGSQLAQRSAMQVLRIENEIFCSWTPEERKTYFDLMERFLSAFQQKVEEIEA